MFKRDIEANASEILYSAAKIYDERNSQYGDSFVVVGHVMKSLFPNGISLSGEDDFRRFHLFEWMVGKIVRYAQNFEQGGHEDSIKDASVYAAMLAFEDLLIRENNEKDLSV